MTRPALSGIIVLTLVSSVCISSIVRIVSLSRINNDDITCKIYTTGGSLVSPIPHVLTYPRYISRRGRLDIHRNTSIHNVRLFADPPSLLQSLAAEDCRQSRYKGHDQHLSLTIPAIQKWYSGTCFEGRLR